jgi:hypothetical protein
VALFVTPGAPGEKVGDALPAVPDGFPHPDRQEPVCVTGQHNPETFGHLTDLHFGATVLALYITFI